MFPARALDARDVAAGARVDPHALALFDEQRHLDGDAGLERGRLGAALGRVAAQARLGVRDGELDVVGRLDAGRLAVQRQQLDLLVLDDPLSAALAVAGLTVTCSKVPGSMSTTSSSVEYR